MKLFDAFFLEGRPRLRAVLGSSAWMMTDRVMRLVAGLFVGMLTARHLGPEGLGRLGYAQVIVVLFMPVATLGIEHVFMRRLVQRPSRQGVFLGTAILLRLAGALGAAALALAVQLSTAGLDKEMTAMVLVISLSLLASPLDMLDVAFQAGGRVQLAVRARWWGLGIGILWRVALVAIGAGPLAFAWVIAIEAFIGAGVVIIAWRAWPGSQGAWRWSRTVAIGLLKVAWPMALSVLLVGLTMRIGQVTVRNYLGDAEMGYYFGAARLAELWYFVPVSLCSAAFPHLLSIRKDRGERAFDDAMVRLFRGLLWIGIGAGLAISLTGRGLIQLLYGSAFIPGYESLLVLAWSGIFVSLGVAKEQWLVQRGLTGFSLAYSLLAVLVNLALNHLLLGRMGAVGAALATLAALVFGNCLALGLHRRTRPLLLLQFRAVLPGRSAALL